MPRLTDIENNLVARIAGTQVSGQPLMAAVRGASGSFRPALRDALQRERQPAAYVAFIEEPVAATTTQQQRGPRFAVYVSARALRAGSDPRRGDVDARGAFLVIEQLHARLEGYSAYANTTTRGVRHRFLDADDQNVYYELLYRIALGLPPLVFDGETFGGPLTITTRPLGPPDLAMPAQIVKQPDDTYLILEYTTGPVLDPALRVVWRGELRAETSAGLDDLIAESETLIEEKPRGDLQESGGPVYLDMRVSDYRALSPRFEDPGGGQFVLPCEVAFAGD